MGYAGDITPREAWELLASDEDAVLLDVRTREEWEQIGVPDTAELGREAAFVEWVGGPLRLPNPAFLDEAIAAGVAEGRPVVVLCRSGVRSAAAAEALTAAGYGPAYNITQGFEGDTGPDGERGHWGWRADGLPWRQG